MVSIMVRQRANFTAGIVLLAAVAATPAGFAQSRFDADAERQQQIVERIQREESRNGAYSEGLIGPLSDLALIYQDRGEHDLAAAVITRVRQVVRANEGLHSLEQIPILQQLIANEEAIGRLETAWELEQDLLSLARRHPGDIRTVPVFRETAAKRMTLVRQYLAGEFPPQLVLGCYYGWPRGTLGDIAMMGDCTVGHRESAVRAIVSDAQTNYAHAIAVMQRNGLYSSDELQELELELLRSIEVIRTHMPSYQTWGYSRPGIDNARFDADPWRSWKQGMLQLAEWDSPQTVAAPALEQDEPPDVDPRLGAPDRAPTDYGIGRRSLERLLAYEIESSAPLHDQVEALVRIADWDLMRVPNSLAFDGYELARSMLEEAGAQASMDEFFSPKIPVVLPTFSPNPLASDATQAAGYIDVAFEISRYGEGRRVHILDSTTDATDADKKHLVGLIQRSRFRPRMTAGEFARASPIVLRYYLGE